MDFLNKLLQEITIAYSTVQKNIELQLHERFQGRKFFPSNKKWIFFFGASLSASYIEAKLKTASFKETTVEYVIIWLTFNAELNFNWRII